MLNENGPTDHQHNIMLTSLEITGTMGIDSREILPLNTTWYIISTARTTTGPMDSVTG
ncbi:MAG: hypothetical protein IIC41_04320 [Candidatus Marinimicrobia bacterium]|nr:hypothetical protein [Candidatus Neomarinimicrobiota bacterium]